MNEEVTELGFAVHIQEQMEAEGRWPDLSRLEAYKPELLGAAVWMLGASVPVRVICEKLKMSPCTVQAISESPRWNLAVVTEKADIVKRAKLALRLSIEHKVELANDGKLNMFDTKLLWDILKELEGGIAQRVEIKISLEEEESTRFFAEARRKLEVAPGMVFEAEVLPHMGGLALPPDGVQTNKGGRHGDSESSGSAH